MSAVAPAAPAPKVSPAKRPQGGSNSRPGSSSRPPSRYPSRSAAPSGDAGGPNKPEQEILFQKYFKSVGPRTYAAQVKKAGNGNHFLVLTEGKRDDKTDEVRKTRMYVYSEDFVELFRMLHETAQFIKANPVPPEIKRRREKFWAKKETGGSAR